MMASAHINELKCKGYARKATTSELEASWPRVWYVPLFVVVNENKFPLKPRCVADFAAKVNDYLLPRPVNLAPLIAGLSRFREQAIAVNADVREMFHQIKVKAEDQQCQRFLWRDCSSKEKPTTHVMQVVMHLLTITSAIRQESSC